MTLEADSTTPVSSRPYKLLDYYDASDADNFFGRSTEAQQLFGLIRDHRLILLYGASGTGKTSLVLAGTGPLLSNAPVRHELIYVRALTEPGPSVRRVVQRRLSALSAILPTTEGAPGSLVRLKNQLHQSFNQSELQDICFEIGLDYEDMSGGTKTDLVRDLVLTARRQSLLPLLVEACRRRRPSIRWVVDMQVEKEAAVAGWDADTLNDAPLADFLSGAAALLDANIVVILDQFEEFFIRLSARLRKAFIIELSGIYDMPPGRVKVLISLREEWLAHIGELEGRIPEVFNNRMRLLPLQRDQARHAIIEPVEKLGIRYEESLVEQLLDDLAVGAPGSDDGAVIPPQLQLVCGTLFSHLKPPETTIMQTTYEQMGGAGGVLRQYLEDELSRLKFDERLLARGLLEELVTSQGTKAVKSAANLALLLGVKENVVAQVLDRLVRARLLRVLERVTDGSVVYELAHEYLIGEIHQSGEVQARKETEELITQEIENWQRLGTLISAEKLALVARLRGQLRLNEQAHELLLRSALQTGIDVDHWLAHVGDVSQRVSILGDAADSESASVRQRAAFWLGLQRTSTSADLLATISVNDSDDNVRAVARDSLSKAAIIPAKAVESLQQAIRGKDRDRRQAALQTLAKLPSAKLPPSLRWRARYTRARGPLLWGLVAAVSGFIVMQPLMYVSTALLDLVTLFLFPVSFDIVWGYLNLSNLLSLVILGGLTGVLQHAILPAGMAKRWPWSLSTIASSTIGWLLGSISVSTVFSLQSANSLSNKEEVIIAGVFGSFLALVVGTSQWWWLRQRTWAKQWPWFTTIGVTAIVLFYAPGNVYLAGGLIGVAFFIMFWRLRRLMTNPREIVAVSAAFLVGSFMWGYAVLDAVQDLAPVLPERQIFVPIDYVGQRDDSSLSGASSRNAPIWFRAPASNLQEITANDFTAVVDLSEVPFGETEVDLQIQTQNPDITILGHDPITVLLEQLVTRDLPVYLELRGSAAQGRAQGEPLMEPEFVTVSGPASRVETLDHARVTVFLNNARETKTELTQPILYDQEGRIACACSLKLSTEQVEVIVPINEK